MDLQIPTGTERSRRLSGEQILKIHVLYCSSLIASRDFADDTVMLLAGVVPSVLAAKGYAGREKVVASFERFFEAKGKQHASRLVQARHHVLSNRIGPQDIARFECVNGIAILANTVPTAFWTIYHVFSDPDILLKSSRASVSVRQHRKGYRLAPFVGLVVA
jgi:hypothetical protein